MKWKRRHDDGVNRLEFSECSIEEARPIALRIIRDNEYEERVLPGGTILYTVLGRKVVD